MSALCEGVGQDQAFDQYRPLSTKKMRPVPFASMMRELLLRIVICVEPFAGTTPRIIGSDRVRMMFAVISIV